MDEILEGPLTKDGMDARGIVLVNAPQSPSIKPRRRNSIPLATITSLANSISSTYRFAHDRVQQASLSLLSKDDLKFTHMKLAEVSFYYICMYIYIYMVTRYLFFDHDKQLLVRAQQNDKSMSLNLHQIVNHLNAGYVITIYEKVNLILKHTIRFAEERPPLIVVPQRDDHTVPANSTSYLPFSVYSVASLNLLAATKAKGTNAYVQAMQFIDVGKTILTYYYPLYIYSVVLLLLSLFLTFSVKV